MNGAGGHSHTAAGGSQATNRGNGSRPENAMNKAATQNTSGVGDHTHGIHGVGNHDHDMQNAGGHTHTMNDSGSHNHTISGNTGDSDGSVSINPKHENRPPYYALAYIMRIK